VFLAIAAAVPAAGAEPEPWPRAVVAVPTSGAERAHAGVAPAAIDPPPRVIDVSPTGDRVPTDAPLVVRFDRDVPESERASLLSFDPGLPGEPSWLDARTVSLASVRWRAGRAQRVTVATREPVSWTFRAKVPMPDAIAPVSGARLILSFDDGPNDPRQADRLLDRLHELGIRALFFPSARWLRTREDWLARAVHEGHRVCNHTLSHVNLTAPWMTEARIRSEIAQGAGDGSCKLFRPPLMGYDKRVEAIAKELGYDLFLWDIDSRDWEGGPAEDVMATVLHAAKPDAVVLLHIHADATYRILPALAERLRSAGYVLSWDPADSPADDAELVGTGGRREWAELLDRPKDTAENPDDRQQSP
jgi:peptidoglycan/xylan/chitin deacetylase (PgdA/CDA1 family)